MGLNFIYIYFIVGQCIISVACLKHQSQTQALEQQMLENTWRLSFVPKNSALSKAHGYKDIKLPQLALLLI